MNSWVFEEYWEIFKKTEIFKNVINNEEELRERYFYAGGSVRLLNEFSPDVTNNFSVE